MQKCNSNYLIALRVQEHRNISTHEYSKKDLITQSPRNVPIQQYKRTQTSENYIFLYHYISRALQFYIAILLHIYISTFPHLSISTVLQFAISIVIQFSLSLSIYIYIHISIVSIVLQVYRFHSYILPQFYSFHSCTGLYFLYIRSSTVIPFHSSTVL